MLTFRPIFSFSLSKSSKIWLHEHVTDPYVKKAQLLNYRSRAAFKLIEINQRYSIFAPGMKVLDLGSTPGGWTQVAVAEVKGKELKNKKDPKAGRILAIDRDPMNEVEGADFLRGDVEEEATRLKIAQYFEMKPIDVIISDMAPNFMGDKDMDHMAISALNSLAFKISLNNLKIGGSVVMKTLQGTLENKFYV